MDDESVECSECDWKGHQEEMDFSPPYAYTCPECGSAEVFHAG